MRSTIARERFRSTVARNAGFGLLLAPWLFVAPQQEQKLVFATHVGSTIAKQFDFEVEMRVARFETNGEGRGSQLFEPPIHLVTSAKFTDSYEKVDEGRPLEFVRRFGEVMGMWKYGGERNDIDGFDALSDTAVRFAWHQAKEVYLRSMESGRVHGLDPDQLVLDTDLCGFLPKGSVKPGAKWTVRGRPLMDALLGSTDMGLLVISADHPENILTRDVLLGPLRTLGEKKMEIACLLSDAEDSLEPHTAQIDLRWDDKSQVDVTDAVNAFLTAQYPEYPEHSVFGHVDSLQLEWKFDGRGRLKWNTAEGHFDSLNLEAAIHLDIDCKLQGLIFHEGPVTVHMSIEGVGKWTACAKRGP